MSVCSVRVVSEYTRYVCVGIDVPWHDDPSVDIDNVVCLVQIDVLFDGCYLAVFDPDVELAIDIICRINDMAVFQN